MDKEKIYLELTKAYENGDIELFDELNNEYRLGLISINQVELLESRLTIDLGKYYDNWNPQYVKNYTTSRFIVNMAPLPKHKLDEYEFKIVSYDYLIFQVLTRLKNTTDLEDVLDRVELKVSKEFAVKFLQSEGFIEISANGEATVTESGYSRLEEVKWVEFYEDFLDYFDVDDFERYVQEHDTGNLAQNALNYLDEHLKIAHKKKQFDRLHDVFSSRAMIYLHLEEFEKALIEESKVFIIKLNALYVRGSDLKTHVALEYHNINNIMELNNLAQPESLKEIIYKAYDDIDSNEMVMRKRDVFRYLTRATEGEVIEDLSSLVRWEYYQISDIY